eukprot:EG_transcript_11890
MSHPEVGRLPDNAALPIADVLRRSRYPPEDSTPYPLLRDLVDRLATQQVVDVQGYLVQEFSDKPQLHRALRLTPAQHHRLTHDISSATLSGGLLPARALLGTEMAVSSGCPVMDRFLKGGFPVGQITELCGQSATGKTQLCLQASLHVTLPVGCGPGPEGSAVYIVSEDFPHRRLYAMARHLCQRFAVPGGGDPALRLLDRLHIRSIGDPAALWVTLLNLGPFIAQTRPPVRLVVLDSVAAVFRGGEGGDAVAKADQLFRCAALLRRTAAHHRLAVLAANQVTGHFDSSRGISGSSSATEGQDDLVVPALGLSWSSCLNARLMLSRSDRFVPAAAEAACSVAEGDAAEGEGEGAATAGVVAVVERRLSVVFAPHLDLGGGSCKYRVTEEGVAGV